MTASITSEQTTATDGLAHLAAALTNARRPEDIFGPDPARAHSVYRQLARAVHPDRHLAASERATQVFARLSAWWALARQRLQQDMYGTLTPLREPPTLVTPSGRSFALGNLWRVGDVADLYTSDAGEFIKVGRHPHDNDLLRNEAETLRRLTRAEHAQDFQHFVPRLVEAFNSHTDGVVLAANVLSCPPGLYSLREVLELRGPLDARDMTWIYRRLLKVLAFTHGARVVHGAVVPEHVLIHPDHGLTLVDWCYAVDAGAPMRAIPTPSRDLYPEFVFARRAARPGLDLFMAAQCMVALLGGDPSTGTMPETVHPRLRTFFSSWWRFGVDQVQDASALLDEFTQLADSLWRRQFRPFSMSLCGT